jgi:hypothetical protein
MMVHRERRDRNPLTLNFSNKWRGNEWPASHSSYFSWYAMSKLVISHMSAGALHVSAIRHFFIRGMANITFRKKVMKCMQNVNRVYSQLLKVMVGR